MANVQVRNQTSHPQDLEVQFTRAVFGLIAETLVHRTYTTCIPLVVCSLLCFLHKVT